jgi:hypothetical protein
MNLFTVKHSRPRECDYVTKAIICFFFYDRNSILKIVPVLTCDTRNECDLFVLSAPGECSSVQQNVFEIFHSLKNAAKPLVKFYEKNFFKCSV